MKTSSETQPLGWWANRIHHMCVDKGFYSDEENRAVPTKIALMHEEISEALKAYREGKMDLYHEYKSGPQTAVLRFKSEGEAIYGRAQYSDKWIEMTHERWLEAGYTAKPEGFGTELADAMIRILDLCGYLGIDIEDLIDKKVAYNETREYKHGRRV